MQQDERTIGERVAQEAISWVGTPFIWQQATKGAGCDCKGLIAGVAKQLGLPEGDSLEALTKDYMVVHEERLLAGLRTHFDVVAKNQPVELGDVILMVVGRKKQHLAICVEVTEEEPSKIVHCYGEGPAAVIMVPVGTAHLAAIDSYWRWRV